MSERLRHLVESHPFQYEDRRYNITVSLGLVSTEGDESLTPNDLIKQADEKRFPAPQLPPPNRTGNSLQNSDASCGCPSWPSPRTPIRRPPKPPSSASCPWCTDRPSRPPRARRT